MEREDVLEIEFIKVWGNNFAWKITKQDKNIFRLGEFEDKDLGVFSYYGEMYDKESNELYLRGKYTEDTYNIGKYNFCTLEEKKLIELKVKEINEKYSIKERWRAERGGYFYYIDFLFEVEQTVETFVEGDDAIYKSGNYFETKEEAQEYAEYMKKCSLEWHEKRDNEDKKIFL